MDDAFKVLQRKDIYELLEGSSDFEIVASDGNRYGMPYLTANDLASICFKFGLSDVFGSRWNIVEELIQYAIENDQCSELLLHFFSLSQFDNLNSIEDWDTIETTHTQIVKAAIDRINRLIRLNRKELVLIDGQFYICDLGDEIVVDSPKVDSIDVAYIRGLRERCETDFISGNFDSVITKSRTLIEETLIYILESNGVTPSESGKVRDLYNQVKTIRNMRQNSDFDNRVNGLLSGLERVVTNIGDMRNINSDSHGVGRRRIVINEKEARLVMNSAITFCEYILI